MLWNKEKSKDELIFQQQWSTNAHIILTKLLTHKSLTSAGCCREGCKSQFSHDALVSYFLPNINWNLWSGNNSQQNTKQRIQMQKRFLLYTRDTLPKQPLNPLYSGWCLLKHTGPNCHHRVNVCYRLAAGPAGKHQLNLDLTRISDCRFIHTRG